MKLTVIDSEQPKTLTKTYSLKGGEIQKTTVASMSKGHAKTVQLDGMSEFAELLKTLKSNQALAFGVTGFDDIGILSKKQFETKGKPSGFIPRAKDRFNWNRGAGIMVLDYDPSKQSDNALSREQLFEALGKVLSLDGVARVWWTSSSSHIYNTNTGEEVNGLKGQRLYIAVTDATDIPRAGKVLFERLWLNDLGWYEISKAGALLERSIIDASVWQTNRLDFAAGAHCAPPLEQRRGEPSVFEGDCLDTKTAIPDLTESEQAELLTIKNRLKTELADDVKAVQSDWIAEVAAKIESRACDPDSVDGLDIATRALTHSTLLGDFPIVLEGGEAVTVGECMDDPAKYHGRLTFDPLEPDYEGGKVVGKLYLIGSHPNLYSFAHGGKTYKLTRQPRRIEVFQGRSTDAVNQTLELLRVMPDIFDNGFQLVGVNNGELVPFDLHRLAHYLGGTAQYYQTKIRRGDEPYEVLSDPPEKVVKQVLALGKARGLKQLDTIINAPILTPDNRLISRAGYDADARLFLDYHDDAPALPAEPTNQQVTDAVNRLMKPFETFPFERDIDRSGLLAGILTAVLRPILPTAPAFGFDAPVQGSGKTLLAKCLAILSTGETPEVWAHVAGQNDDEIRKRLFTALRQGKRTLVWDNVMGAFNSASIASLLTSPVMTDRVLGASESGTVSNRLLFLATGNNLILQGELPRRFIKVRIDPKTDRPYARQFELDPEQYVKQNRFSMVMDALLIVRAWFSSNACLFGDVAEGRMASFEVWDDMVRQPLCWVNREILTGNYPDVMELIDEAQQSDPEQDVLCSLLNELRDSFGGDAFNARQVKDSLVFNDDLRETFSEITKREKPTTQGIARVLSYRKGRMVKGLRLTEAPKDTVKNVQQWRIDAVPRLVCEPL